IGKRWNPLPEQQRDYHTGSANGTVENIFIPAGKVKYPYSESWNLGVQRTFGSNYTAEVRYVGSRGVHLNVQNRINVQSIVTPTNFLPTFTDGCNADCQTMTNSPTSLGQTTLKSLNAQL